MLTECNDRPRLCGKRTEMTYGGVNGFAACYLEQNHECNCRVRLDDRFVAEMALRFLTPNKMTEEQHEAAGGAYRFPEYLYPPDQALQ